MTYHVPVFVPGVGDDGEVKMVRYHDSERYVRWADWERVEKENEFMRVAGAESKMELSANEFRLSAQVTAIKQYLRGETLHADVASGVESPAVCPCGACKAYRAVTKILEAEPPVA